MTRKGSPKLSAIDLNLLVALDALLREESVTAAGKSIGLSQPATSHALSKLRELLDDELLVRDGRRMKRTVFGRSLAPVVERLIGDLEATLLTRRAFEPATSRRTFRVAMSDYCGTVILPSLLEGLRREAPQITLDVHPAHGALPEAALASGELDAVLGTFLEVSPGLGRTELFDEGFVVVVRASDTRRLSLARYAARDHLLVANPGYGPGVVDYALEARGLQRRVAVRVPHFLVAPAIVARTDLVLTLPERIARAMGGEGVRLQRAPLELDRFPVQLFWHERRAQNPAITWLREAITDACAAL